MMKIGDFVSAVLVCLLFSIAALPLSVSAQGQGLYAAFYFDTVNPFTLTGAAVVEANEYNEPVIFEDIDGFTDYSLLFEDKSGNVVASYSLMEAKTVIRYDMLSGAGKMKISKEGVVYFESPISFCDKDGKCEPCSSPNCSVVENSLTCSDCRASSADLYCDQLNDGVCDPDCGLGSADPDCERDCSQDCGPDDGVVMYCDDYSGVACGPNDDCIGGLMVYADDEMYCCVGGRCGDTGEYVETVVEMQSGYPTITPSGALASEVRAYGIGDYCTKKLGGEICDVYDSCEGRSVEYYYQTFCCLGNCVTPPDSQFDSLSVLDAGWNMTSPSLRGYYDFDILKDEPVVDEEALWFALMSSDDFASKEEMERQLGEELAEEQARYAFRQRMASVVPAVPQQLKGSGLTVVVGTLLLLLLVVAVLVALFRRSAAKKLAGSARQAAQAPSYSGADLQGQVSSLVSKGYSYAQVRDFLIKQGRQQADVDAAIRKDYELRKSQQVQR